MFPFPGMINMDIADQFLLLYLSLMEKRPITFIFCSQFSDIYREDYFIDYLAPDIRIVKELPEELLSLDLEAIGSVVSSYTKSLLSSSFYQSKIIFKLLSLFDHSTFSLSFHFHFSF